MFHGVKSPYPAIYSGSPEHEIHVIQWGYPIFPSFFSIGGRKRARTVSIRVFYVFHEGNAGCRAPVEVFSLLLSDIDAPTRRDR
jgi:hypothetical protein